MKPATALILFSALLSGSRAHADDGWWNKAWPQRQKITLDTTADAAAVATPVNNATVLVRLHDGNFPFASAATDGSDLRFVSADGKTLLPHELESFDGLLNEAYVWVKLPEVQASAKQDFYLYFGNPAAEPASFKPTDAHDEGSTLIYHFAGIGAPAQDSSAAGNNSQAPFTSAEGSLIGGGLRMAANTPLTIPSSPSLAWASSSDFTLALWIKPTALQDQAVVLSRGEGSASFALLLNQGAPQVRVGDRSSAAAVPIAAGAWSHLALVASSGKIQLYVNGLPYAALDSGLPALESPILLGAGQGGFSGELDELSFSKTARSEAWIRLAAISQGTSEAAQRTLQVGAPEGGAAATQSHLMEHLSLFGDIANNMMFDGWIAIGVCAIMIVIGWTVAIRKFLYLNAIEKGTREFLKQWKALAHDLTAIDTENVERISSLGGNMDAAQQQLVQKSPLYQIYHIGADEIRHRLGKGNTRRDGLSGRSIQAIRASLDAGLVHENHRLTDGLVYLTISIAGGPYVGLLGTVVGVMITFAIIAKSGEVNVNSIAPGIASALLATVVGLVVAIPALFIYSYLNGRIRNSLALMQVFIDEFVAKMAEFYHPAPDARQAAGVSTDPEP